MRLSLAILALAAAGCHVTTIMPSATIASGYDSYVVSEEGVDQTGGSLLLQSVEAGAFEVETFQVPGDVVDPLTLQPLDVFDPTILDLPRPLPGTGL